MITNFDNDPTQGWAWDPERGVFMKPGLLFDDNWTAVLVPMYEANNPVYQFDPKRHRIYQDVLREQEMKKRAEGQAKARKRVISDVTDAVKLQEPEAAQRFASEYNQSYNLAPNTDGYLYMKDNILMEQKLRDAQPQQSQPPAQSAWSQQEAPGWSVYQEAPKPKTQQQQQQPANYADRFNFNKDFRDPNSWSYTPPTPLHERNYKVIDSKGNYLFSLGNPNAPIEVIPYKELHKTKIQWFAETADNYMQLYEVNPNIEKLETIYHVNRDKTNEFISRDFPLEEYGTGKTGDWKNNPQEANGALLSEIDGYPIRTDAIGQLPYSVGAYRFFSKFLPERLAEEATKLGGNIFATGKNPLYFRNWDFSNSYDNYMIEAGIQYEKARTGKDFNRMRYLDKMGQNPFDPRNPILDIIPLIPDHIDGGEFKYPFPTFKKEKK